MQVQFLLFNTSFISFDVIGWPELTTSIAFLAITGSIVKFSRVKFFSTRLNSIEFSVIFFNFITPHLGNPIINKNNLVN